MGLWRGQVFTWHKNPLTSVDGCTGLGGVDGVPHLWCMHTGVKQSAQVVRDESGTGECNRRRGHHFHILPPSVLCSISPPFHHSPIFTEMTLGFPVLPRAHLGLERRARSKILLVG